MKYRLAILFLSYFAGVKTVECAPFIGKPSRFPWFAVRGGEEVSVPKISTPVTIKPEMKIDATVEKSDDEVPERTMTKSNLPDLESLVFAASKVGDGSESDPDGIPSRFLKMQKGNRGKAKHAFEQTLKWREEHEVDTILKRPHSKFDLCKKIFPVYIPGRDQQNHVVVVQRVGLIDIDYGEKNGVTGDDLLMHYIYMVEYCWNILDPAPDAIMTTVMDLKGVKFQTIRDGNIRKFLRKFVSAMSDNYPNRCNKTLVINAPAWINAAYKLVKPLLRSSTRKKITIINGGKQQDQLLIDILGTDHVPQELLNNPTIISPAEGTEHVLSDIEKEMRELCVASLKKHGVKMESVV